MANGSLREILNDLDLAASVVYFLHPELNKNIVIFGHTHRANL